MARACPVCGTTVQVDLTSPCFPFCSPRCKTIDLGNWISGRYVIGEEIPESEGTDADDEERGDD